MWSRYAYTPRRTVHKQFLAESVAPKADYGYIGDDKIHIQTQPGWTAIMVARAAFKAIKEYRDTIDGPVLLVWRIEPEIERREKSGVRIYTRLCFEPDLWDNG